MTPDVQVEKICEMFGGYEGKDAVFHVSNFIRSSTDAINQLKKENDLLKAKIQELDNECKRLSLVSDADGSGSTEGDKH